tara:strand:- start:457 stop:1320 length:864 start_codon:yes stop_codon:yes gene_type:complete
VKELIPQVKILPGDCMKTLRSIEPKSVNTCVTSPPYWGLRDYKEGEQLGLEDTPEKYVDNLIEVFREVRRVLRDDGTVWLNLGDSYQLNKQMVGIPWRVALRLQEDGWILRQDIIWYKPNAMPESVKSRCTKAHEYIFLLSKNSSYYYDFDSIKEEADFAGAKITMGPKSMSKRQATGRNIKPSGNAFNDVYDVPQYRNKRSVWTVTTKPYKGAHFATYPPDLIRPCILAGCPEGGTVLDPFAGSGTTGLVAAHSRRNAILCELNPEYQKIIRNRLGNDMFIDVIQL